MRTPWQQSVHKAGLEEDDRRRSAGLSARHPLIARLNPKRIGGMFLTLVGLIVLAIGFYSMDSFPDQLEKFFSREYSEPTIWYMLGGTSLIFAGVVLAVFVGRNRHG